MTDRVKRALLAMQRYNWEQGVTAQAFLEAGDHLIELFKRLFQRELFIRSHFLFPLLSQTG